MPNRPRFISRTRLLIALIAALFAVSVFLHQRMQSSHAVSTTLVINEIDYDQVGTDSAEFLELKNVSGATINLANYTVELVNGASGGAAIYQTIVLPNVNLVAGDYFVICANAATVANCDLDVNPNTNLVQNGNPDGVGIRLSGTLQDAVSYGGNTGAPYTEGSGTGLLDNADPNTGISRCADGVDTDVNNVDLSLRSITPGATNSCTVADTAPSVSTTTPAAGATNVPPANNISVTFSEPANVTGNWFQIACGTSGTRNVADTVVTGGPTTYSINPNADFAYSESCTVTIFAAQVSDQDTNDPPDQMVSNFAFSFTTENPVDTAPTISSTTPANGATGVAANSNIVINFSESVTASANAFSIHCPTGVPQTFSQTASPATSFTLDPTADLPYSTVCSVTVTANQITDTDINDPPDNMASNFSFSFTTAAAPPPVIINEIDSDTPGADAAEFIELYDGGVGNFPLTGLVVVLYNGNTDQSYAAFDLDGYTTDANGYFTLGNLGTGATFTFAGNTLQNGADAVALFVGDASSFPTNTPVTTVNLVDAIVYGTDDSDDPELLVLLNAGQPQVNEGGGATNSVARCPNGSGGGRNTFTYSQGAPSLGLTNNCPPTQPPSTSPILISEVYGGGGNAGATYQNDYVELYNRSASPVDTAGWSIQYTSADGNSWEFGTQPLGGIIGPGEYYLIALGSGGANGSALPPSQINGQINMSGTSGKVALVNSFTALVGNCPLGDPSLMDFVGYGTPDCREGASPAPAPSNTTSILRQGGGSVDTNNNGNDFATGAPNPQQTAPIVELGPLVLSTDPRNNGTNAPRDASMTITFTEPVTVVDPWFDITCVDSGQHNSATFAVTNGGRTYVITPNANFMAGEQCTATIFASQIHDIDANDSGPNTDTLPANYVWSFTVATGTAPPYLSSVHLTFGDPGCNTIYGCAAASTAQPLNFLMDKPEYSVSYNRDRGTPNWVSWHLTDEWFGTLQRVDTFRPDPQVPAEWYRVQAFDYSGSGFDRGHNTPNADRDKETSIPINQATFLMTNMIPQAPAQNQGPWADMENDLRTDVSSTNEMYIVMGVHGTGGTGNAGFAATIAGGKVTVPATVWKVVLVLPKGENDISRVDCSTRTLAVIMPNSNTANPDWTTHITTVDAVEALTGYDFFQNLPDPYERCVEAGTNGSNPPLDTDNDGTPDTTDTDDDNDGFTDTVETAAGSDPLNPNSTPEVCDGLDNDLNQGVDEGFTDTNNDGQADCVDTDDDGDGVSDTDEAAAGSDPLNPASTPEICDGVDNDLNQGVDEGFTDTNNDGQADCVDTDDDGDGVSDTDEAAAGSDPLNPASTPEICDGVDNDLNQGVDEGFTDTNNDGQADCVDTDDDGDGVSDTDEAAAGSDPLNPASTPEVCDGVDNDLNQGVDEGFTDTNNDGQADCVDTDDDGDGVSDTDEAAAGSDPLNPASTPEVCDGVDNDLNQGVDEGFPNTDGDGQANCVDNDDDNDGFSDAVETAAGSDPLNANSTPEVCDGVDNDLNQGVDEGFTDTNNDGQADCVDTDDDGDGVSDTDEAAAGSDPLNPASTPEVCDGVDNDLNQGVDEGFTDTNNDGQADCVDTDDDGDGVSDTDEAAAGSDPLNPASTPEVCDGVDNDLNQGVDEGFTDTNNDGQADCVDTDDDGDGVSDTDEAAAGSDPLNPASTPEVCDGVDNDLNQGVDEGFPNTDGDGQANCVDNDDDNDGFSDAVETAAGSDPLNANSTPEVCDGVDNDLNQGVDEGFPNNDGDSQADCVDNDDDNDEVPDTNDNCPFTANANQADFDQDGIGDVCDSTTGPPTNKDQCKNGGWMRFDSPRTFSNQGDCIQFVNTGAYLWQSDLTTKTYAYLFTISRP